MKISSYTLLCVAILFDVYACYTNPFNILTEYIDRNLKEEQHEQHIDNAKINDVVNHESEVEVIENEAPVLDDAKDTTEIIKPEIKIKFTKEDVRKSEHESEVEVIVNEAVTTDDEAPQDEAPINFSRVRLPTMENLKVNHTFTTLLPGDIEANVTVLSLSPLVYEVDGLLDPEECDLLVAIAKGKQMKPMHQQIVPLEIKTVNKLFQDWDYDQDGFITQNEILLVPSLADIKMSMDDVDDMFFMLKMDQNNDGKVSLNELQNTDVSKMVPYFNDLRSNPKRLRNVTFEGVWVWADEDDMMKYEKKGYFEEYHNRLEEITEVPSELWAMSEPLQVKHYLPGQFQTPRHDSEAVDKDLPCCLYGDINKMCRICRYLSFNLFLNDVEEGGELVFPLANHPYQDIMENSGEWRGFYMYSKTTGSKTYFTVNMTFSLEGVNRVFKGDGNEGETKFSFENSIILGETAKFEKKYSSSSASEEESPEYIKYEGKVIENTRISGFWWVPGEQRMNGRFFMWNRAYEIYSSEMLDQSNRNGGCLKAPLRIKPKKGKAVFWYNHHQNPLNGMVGAIHHEAITANCEVNQGEKWMASSWLNVIGDGELKLRTWRRGTNLLRDTSKAKRIYRKIGTNEPKLEIEEFEKQFYAEVHNTNGGGVNNNNNNNSSAMHYGHQYKPMSNALQAVNLLINDLSSEQLAVMASKVHKILGLECLPGDMKF